MFRDIIIVVGSLSSEHDSAPRIAVSTQATMETVSVMDAPNLLFRLAILDAKDSVTAQLTMVEGT